MKPIITPFTDNLPIILSHKDLLTNLTGKVIIFLLPLFFLITFNRPKSQIPFTTIGSTKTSHQRCFIHIKFIVKSKFSVSLNIFYRENANSKFPQHVPFLCDTVGFATMVNKSSNISLNCWIDHFFSRKAHQISANILGVLYNFASAVVTSN